MARPHKFPELQSKFDKALKVLLEGNDTLSGPSLIEGIASRSDEFGISEDEILDLESNMSNYITRAKNAGILISHGKRKGYSLDPEGEAEDAVMATNASPQTQAAEGANLEENATPPAENIGRRNAQWESFLHLPLSLFMSARYQAYCISLSATTNRLKWGNPDILMARESDFQALRLRIGPEVIENLSLVHASPNIILSSVEVKYNLGKSRAGFFEAIAQASVNGSWANESWLVFVNSGFDGEGLEPDIQELARRNGVGVIEGYVDEADGMHTFDFKEHVTARRRSHLGLDSSFTEKKNMLNAASDAISTVGSDNTYLAVDGDWNKVATLIELSLSNLSTQAGFTTDINSAFATLAANDPEFLRRICTSILNSIPTVIDRLPANDYQKDLDEALDVTFSAQKCRRVKALIKVLNDYHTTAL